MIYLHVLFALPSSTLMAMAGNAGVVPIYYGAPDITNFMPPESFIHGNNYTYDELGKLINSLNNDPGEYQVA